MSAGLTPLATKGLTSWLQEGGGGMLWRRPTCKEIRTAHILCFEAALGLISAWNFTFHCSITGHFDMDLLSPSSNPQLRLNPGSTNPLYRPDHFCTGLYSWATMYTCTLLSYSKTPVLWQSEHAPRLWLSNINLFSYLNICSSCCNNVRGGAPMSPNVCPMSL